MKKNNACPALLLVATLLFVVVKPHAQLNQWTWKHGLNAINQYGTYGTLGVPASTNMPSPRHAATTWTDAYGQLWMFGGNRYSTSFQDSLKNDLWKWNGSQWTWVGGSNTYLAPANYGTQGVAASTNWPGGRSTTVSWTDAAGKVWIFGGWGTIGGFGGARLNDLWNWDGTNWTWVKGAQSLGAPGVPGTKGVAAAANTPSGRNYAVSWKDAAGNAYVFSGTAINNMGNTRSLNDLWKWDGTNWTWISGNMVGNTAGVYGTKGVATATNMPGSRMGAISWNDAAGNGWVFGGNGYDAAGTLGLLNDLWKWDGTNWTWMGGSNTANPAGVYGTQGVTAATNMPGGRYFAMSWTDHTGEVWMIGGNGYGASGGAGSLNDMWKWDGTNWTWMGGNSTINPTGNYGTMGVAAATNYPGAKERPALWKDYNGNIWLFGGNGYASSAGKGFMNDMWYYKMHNIPLPLQLLSFTGSLQQQEAVLVWNTTGEMHTRDFVLERSTDGRSFHPIGTIAAKGSGDGRYSFTDKNITGYTSLYYRLAIVDRCGNSTYSNIVQLTVPHTSSNFIYPNPARNSTTLYTSGAADRHTSATLYNSYGKQMMQVQVHSSATTIGLEGLAAGVYYLKMKEGNTMKILKQ